MKRTLIILIFITNVSFSQEKKIIYVDENFKEISLDQYKNKFKSKLFLEVTVKKDTAIFKKLRFKEYFGRLDHIKKSQLNRLFIKRYVVDTSKIWLIHYKHFLPNIEQMPEESRIIYIDSLNKPTGKILNFKNYSPCNIANVKLLRTELHKYEISYKEFRLIIPKELKEFKNIKNLEFLHFYDKNKGYPVEKDNYKWLKDHNSILRKSFSDGMFMYRTIVIYPNGEFYLSETPCRINEKKYLRKKTFKKMQKEFYNLYN